MFRPVRTVPDFPAVTVRTGLNIRTPGLPDPVNLRQLINHTLGQHNRSDAVPRTMTIQQRESVAIPAGLRDAAAVAVVDTEVKELTSAAFGQLTRRRIILCPQRAHLAGSGVPRLTNVEQDDRTAAAGQSQRRLLTSRTAADDRDII